MPLEDIIRREIGNDEKEADLVRRLINLLFWKLDRDEKTLPS